MKTKNILLAFLAIIIVVGIHAQVKIGNNPNTIDPNSLIELESTDKGFLGPRVVLNNATSVAPLTAPVPVGMLVFSSGGSLTDGFYYWSGTTWLRMLTSANSRNNYVLVKSAADFPAPVAGVITLVAGTLYEINGTIMLTSKINLNNCTLMGRDRANDRLIYTPATGELFTGSNGGNILNLTLVAATPGAKLFNLDAGGDPSKSFLLQLVYVLNCDNVGLVKGFGGFVVLQSVAFSNNTNGITFQDLGHLVEMNTFWIQDNHNTYQTLTGTFGDVLISGGENDVLSVFSAKALDITGITSINGGELKAAFFTGNGTYVVGNFSSEWEVESSDLRTEKDDVAAGNFYISTPAVTSFSAINTPTKVLGTTTSSDLFRVALPANNRLTYTGTKTKRFLVICSLSLTASANNKIFSLYIAKNGVILPESKQSRKLATGTDQGAMALSCVAELTTNDYLEVWVENNTDNTSMTVLTLNMSIK